MSLYVGFTSKVAALAGEWEWLEAPTIVAVRTIEDVVTDPLAVVWLSLDGLWHVAVMREPNTDPVASSCKFKTKALACHHAEAFYARLASEQLDILKQFVEGPV